MSENAVLIQISGGVGDYESVGDVDVVLWDWDNWKEDEDYEGSSSTIEALSRLPDRLGDDVLKGLDPDEIARVQKPHTQDTKDDGPADPTKPQAVPDRAPKGIPGMMALPPNTPAETIANIEEMWHDVARIVDMRNLYDEVVAEVGARHTVTLALDHDGNGSTHPYVLIDDVFVWKEPQVIDSRKTWVEFKESQL